jgi:hypothetical protein
MEILAAAVGIQLLGIEYNLQDMVQHDKSVPTATAIDGMCLQPSQQLCSHG